jgi:hypothetical protein
MDVYLQETHEIYYVQEFVIYVFLKYMNCMV